MTETQPETFAIIRNAPPPPLTNARGRCRENHTQATRNRYPWGELAVGDAFDVPLASYKPVGDGRWPEYNRLSAVVSQRNRSHPQRYIVRMMDGYFVRCWRVA